MILTCTPWPPVPMLLATQSPASYRYRQPRTARTITTLGSTTTWGSISLTSGPDETHRFRSEATDRAPRDFPFRGCKCECENCVATGRRFQAILLMGAHSVGMLTSAPFLAFVTMLVVVQTQIHCCTPSPLLAQLQRPILARRHSVLDVRPSTLKKSNSEGVLYRTNY